MKTFRIHWRSGELEDMKGSDMADAFNRAGYYVGVLKAVDWIEEVKEVETKKNLESRYCERLEKMKQKGIDYNQYCGCNETEGGKCTAITKLERTVEWLKGCCTY